MTAPAPHPARITDHPFTGDAGAWNRDECEFSRDEVTRFPDCWAPRLLHADPGVDPRPPRAEQTQPSGYTPPTVGAPTWPRANGPGPTILERGDRLVIEWPNGRGMSWVAPKVIEGWVEQVNDLRGALERSRAEAGPLSHTLARSIRRAAEFRTERDALQAEVTRLRAVIAHAYADLMMDDSHSAMSGVDSAIARLRAAGGGQP